MNSMRQAVTADIISINQNGEMIKAAHHYSYASNGILLNDMVSKSEHLLSLELAFQENTIIIHCSNEPYLSQENIKKIRIYLPEKMNNKQLETLYSIKDILYSYDRLTIHTNITKNNQVYIYKAVAIDSKNQEFVDRYIFDKNDKYKVKKKISDYKC